MSIIQQIENDFNQAFKEKNELAVLTLRQLKAALTNLEISKNREPLTEGDVIKLLRTEVKRRKEASELYRQGGRPELADKEIKEIGLIAKYLPPEIGSDGIRTIIAAVIAKVGANGLQDSGKVMGLVMKELGGAADGNVVSQLVKEELSR